MTYATFLIIFLALPLAALAAALRRRLLDRRFLYGAAGLVLLSLLYMAPWDHLASVWGLWSWTPGRTLGPRWWSVPPEEFAFCALEALLAVVVTHAILTRRPRTPLAPPDDGAQP
jgi:lycopene cyclase domain-containing protein